MEKQNLGVELLSGMHRCSSVVQNKPHFCYVTRPRLRSHTGRAHIYRHDTNIPTGGKPISRTFARLTFRCTRTWCMRPVIISARHRLNPAQSPTKSSSNSSSTDRRLQETRHRTARGATYMIPVWGTLRQLCKVREPVRIREISVYCCARSVASSVKVLRGHKQPLEAPGGFSRLERCTTVAYKLEPAAAQSGRRLKKK